MTKFHSVHGMNYPRSTIRLFYRMCSSNSNNCTPEIDIMKLLNKPLKLLYSKIHPDRFAQQPEIAFKNQKSLQNLNVLIDMLSNRKEEVVNKTSASSLETLLVEFYIPTTTEQQTSNQENQKWKQVPVEENQETQVKQISVPLVYDPSQREWLHLLGSLINLFRSCNIEFPEQLLRITRQRVHEDREGHRDMSLSQLLKRDVVGKAYELRIRNKRHAADALLKDRVAYECKVRRASLSRAHAIQLEIGEDVSPSMAVQGLRRLADCIEQVIVRYGISIRGGVIQLNGGAKVEQDSCGILHLGLCARVSCWEEALKSDTFLSSCSEKSKMKEEFLEMESELAHAWNVRLVCGDSLVEREPQEYLKILSSHIQSMRHDNHRFVSSFDETSSHLLKEYVSIMFRIEIQRFEEESEWGILSIPKDATLKEILMYLQERAVPLAQMTRKKQRERAQIEAVRKSLRLERLKREDQVVSFLEFRKCCDRLAAASSELKPILQGLSVVVSDHFKVADNGEVYVPYYFEWEKSS
ncbi:hypothetical protein GpartN1_g5898.t1 [Galdieria partita]|uniref:DUF4460 domain-containing protein n=1 Tax=Galdieria partita TaxID=83374 RepID=A0A9C7USW8_9RHOD|nr:hypothetical protein GpartN1_g5898.t1 [Galdieria partita]